LIRDIRKILQHPALALPHFSPFSFFFFPALEKLRRGTGGTIPTKKRLSWSARSYVAAVGMNVLRVHLRLNGKSEQGDGKANENRCWVCHR
jgi:hypothetical protein